MKNTLLTLLLLISLATLAACGGESSDDEVGRFDNYKSGEFVETKEAGKGDSLYAIQTEMVDAMGFFN